MARLFSCIALIFVLPASAQTARIPESPSADRVVQLLMELTESFRPSQLRGSRAKNYGRAHETVRGQYRL